MTTTSAVGKAGEMLVIIDLMTRGCGVYSEVTDATATDLLVYHEGKYFKVQVKTVTDSSTGQAGLPLAKKRRTKDGSFQVITYLDKVDIIALAVMDRRQVVYLACDQAQNKSNVSVRFDPPKNNQKNVRYACDLTFEKAFGM